MPGYTAGGGGRGAPGAAGKRPTAQVRKSRMPERGGDRLALSCPEVTRRDLVPAACGGAGPLRAGADGPKPTWQESSPPPSFYMRHDSMTSLATWDKNPRMSWHSASRD
ncbi:uncharacterized protein LOC143688621 [Tamandua tetradactyla]|uniref:uncharacterized protein LOC143688621 n=1 Tax=Tamandua tetradactyla TaxID=48850 RepID=UPI004053D075